MHEQFTGEELNELRGDDDAVKIIAHPECPPDVIEASDFTGSTKGMIDWVKTNKPARVVLVTECSMSANIAAELPQTRFIKPCNMCPHMKRITLENILHSLVHMRNEVTIDPEVADRARRAVERMVNLRH